MGKNKNTVGPGEVKINCHDPRNHHEFLQLSVDMNSWKEHVHDRSWWLTQENRCMMIFQRYGYDLQTGVWFCLISGHRHGWAGIASSTLLLAEAFGKMQRQCWPPRVAIDLRKHIIDWYCNHAASGLYSLPLFSAEIVTLRHLEGAITMLLDHAVNLQSRCQITLRAMRDYLHTGQQSLQKHLAYEKSVVQDPTLVNIPRAPGLISTGFLSPRQRHWGSLLTGGVIGATLAFGATGAMHWLEQPSTAIRLNHLWPGNALSLRWENRVAQQVAVLPAINSWALLYRQLEDLEQRLLDTEKNRKSYITISELKTVIYQMRDTLRQGGIPAVAQLDELQRKIDNQEPVSAVEVEAVSQYLEALNSKFIQLTTKL